ncbi:alcohol dehydrogenase catalytic domain-containing protein [Paraburkholderia phymatum]|uniref:zinc-dependent alcohol dehydrogenase n=1 Tax=Paraburkholderia phymatum TaxID=148447 RepID=UPI00317EF1B6
MHTAVIHGPGDIRLDPTQVPVPGPHDVVIKVAACGICGSDVTYAKLGGVAGPAGPMPLGHELAGTISSVGAQVAGFREGQRVIVNPYANMIGNGGPEGAFTDYLLVRDALAQPDTLFAVPDNVSMEHAALAEPLAVALHGVNRAEPQPGQKVVVFGAGPIGLGAVLGLRRRGVEDIVSVDYSSFRLECARRLGARATINAAEQNVRERLGELHGTQHDFVTGSDAVSTDTYIDMAGAPPLIPSILEMCRMGARIVVTAVYSAPVAIDLRLMLAKEATLTTAIGYPIEFREIVAMLEEGRVDLEPMISHRFSFADFNNAFETARDAQRSAKVMVTFP